MSQKKKTAIQCQRGSVHSSKTEAHAENTTVEGRFNREEAIARLLEKDIPAVFGVNKFPSLGRMLLAQVGALQAAFTDVQENEVLLAMETAAAFRPRNSIEAMLIAQIAGVHAAAISALYTAGMNAQRPEIADLHANRATRLMKLYLQQVEALSKLRGESRQQQVVVERVDVMPGGQAVVGAISN